MIKATRLSECTECCSKKTVTFGVFAACDPRIDQPSRTRTVNIIKTIADIVAETVKMPDGSSVNVVYAPVLVDAEPQADLVAAQFRQAGVDALICCPDTWAFPQLSVMSLLSQMPNDMPINFTVGNSGPKPGVVFAHAVNGALAQSGRMTHLNVGSWPDTGMNPKPSASTAAALVDWCYAALTRAGLKGKRVVVFGHDSMGMETALAHVIPTRNTFGLEIARIDMKLLSDMLTKGAYDKKEAAGLRAWVDKHIGKRLDMSQPNASKKFNQSLGLYLIIRDMMDEMNAVGGGFMNQLEWGSEPKGTPLPIADLMESLFNSTFDHNGRKEALPFATEADVQGLLTMLFKTWLSGGNPPLFMDFRKVWEPAEAKALAKKLKIPFTGKEPWAANGFVDGDNSGSASLDWAAKPGTSVDKIMKNIGMPGADLGYFAGGGNSVTFITPGGINGIASRLAYSQLTGMFSLLWDEASSISLPAKLAKAVANTSTPTWPHTWVMPKYATMTEYKQFAPANHFHMTWDLPVARLQYWMDLANVLSVAPWQKRPQFIEGTDRPTPLMYLINGGEDTCKLKRAGAI